MPIFHDGNGLIKNTKTVDARVCAPVTGEPLAGVPLMGGVPMPTPATMRPVVRFSAVGQVNVHPLLVGGLASIWCRVRGTLGYSCLPGCLPMAFSLDTGMVTNGGYQKNRLFPCGLFGTNPPTNQAALTVLRVGIHQRQRPPNPVTALVTHACYSRRK